MLLVLLGMGADGKFGGRVAGFPLVLMNPGPWLAFVILGFWELSLGRLQ